MQPGPTRPLAWLAALLTFVLAPLVAPVLAAPPLAPPRAADTADSRQSALAAAPQAPGRALAQEDPLLPEDSTPGGAAGAAPTATPLPSGGSPSAPAPGAAGPASPGAAPAASAPAAPPTPPSSTMVSVDRPVPGATTAQRFTIMGWAADPEGAGTGVDAVHIYLDGDSARGTFLGAASYGEERLDVAAQLGQPRFGLSGYSLQIEIPPGAHTLYVQARRRGSTGSGAWSPPALLDVVATPAVSVAEGGRVQLPSAGCPRAPDGSCTTRVGMTSPTCPQIGPGGQCLPAAPGAVPPGWVGAPIIGTPSTTAPPGTSNSTSICLQYDATGNCVSNTGGPTAAGSPFTLRAETNGGMATLTWMTLRGAQTYELLRCTAATGQGCTSVTVVTATSYQLPQTPNTWYVVQARGGNSQVIGTSNVIGPT
jgi:hypothetical protein